MRDEFDILLRNYEVEITSGEPEVPQPYSGTQYVDWKWMKPEEFRRTAETGSLCTSLLLDSRNLNFQMPDNIDRSSVKHFNGEIEGLRTRRPESHAVTAGLKRRRCYSYSSVRSPPPQTLQPYSSLSSRHTCEPHTSHPTAAGRSWQ